MIIILFISINEHEHYNFIYLSRYSKNNLLDLSFTMYFINFNYYYSRLKIYIELVLEFINVFIILYQPQFHTM